MSPRPSCVYPFALSRVGLDGLLCLPTEPRHVDELVAAMERGPQSLEEEEHMIELAATTNDAQLRPARQRPLQPVFPR